MLAKQNRRALGQIGRIGQIGQIGRIGRIGRIRRIRRGGLEAGSSSANLRAWLTSP
jgi:hypothetical protein